MASIILFLLLAISNKDVQKINGNISKSRNNKLTEHDFSRKIFIKDKA